MGGMLAVLAPSSDPARPRAVPNAAAGEATIEARSIVQRFGAKVVLDSVSLAVPASRIHALLGPNGVGKTTLIRILSGLLVPGGGTVRVLVLEADSSRAFRRLIGLVPPATAASTS